MRRTIYVSFQVEFDEGPRLLRGCLDENVRSVLWQGVVNGLESIDPRDAAFILVRDFEVAQKIRAPSRDADGGTIGAPS
jgi:hypothetical protein